MRRSLNTNGSDLCDRRLSKSSIDHVLYVMKLRGVQSWSPYFVEANYALVVPVNRLKPRECNDVIITFYSAAKSATYKSRNQPLHRQLHAQKQKQLLRVHSLLATTLVI